MSRKLPHMIGTVLSDLEKRWLIYARGVFTCASHRIACDAPSIGGIDPTLRWPGFVGPSYLTAKKKLLLLGRVHNPSGWKSGQGLTILESIVHRWLGGNLSDVDFYRAYNDEYARQLATWGPWTKVFKRLAAAAGVDEFGVSYANVAKCWQLPGKESKLQKQCSIAFPIETLVKIIQPDGIFLLAPDTWLSTVPSASVHSKPFLNDSAPHFLLPEARISAAITWVQAL